MPSKHKNPQQYCFQYLCRYGVIVLYGATVRAAATRIFLNMQSPSYCTIVVQACITHRRDYHHAATHTNRVRYCASQRHVGVCRANVRVLGCVVRESATPEDLSCKRASLIGAIIIMLLRIPTVFGIAQANGMSESAVRRCACWGASCESLPRRRICRAKVRAGKGLPHCGVCRTKTKVYRATACHVRVVPPRAMRDSYRRVRRRFVYYVHPNALRYACSSISIECSISLFVAGASMCSNTRMRIGSGCCTLLRYTPIFS